MIVFNLKTHKEEDVFAVGNSPDVLAYDRNLKILYVACESGVVSVFISEQGKLKKVGDVEAGPNSHTVSVDSNTHKIYLPIKNLKGSPVLRIMIPKM